MNRKIIFIIAVLFVVAPILAFAQSFPTSLNSFSTGDIIEAADWNAIEAEIGIDGSAVITSLNYLVVNSASIDPGHQHTSASVSGIVGPAWEAFNNDINILTPTTTGAAILINNASSTITNLVMETATSTSFVVGTTNPSGFDLGDGDLFIGGNATTTGNFSPNSDSSSDLGNSTTFWANVYADKFVVKGTGGGFITADAASILLSSPLSSNVSQWRFLSNNAIKFTIRYDDITGFIRLASSGSRLETDTTFAPRTDSSTDLGTTDKFWDEGFFDELVFSNAGTGATAANTIRLGGSDLSAGDAGLLITTENDTDHLFASLVGIATTTPASTLTVDGTFAVGTNGIEFIVDASGNATTTASFNIGSLSGGGTQCVQVDNNGLLAGTGSACGLGASSVMARIAGSTFSTVQHMQNIFHSAGWVSGGGITDDGDGTITVAVGTGLIRATDGATVEILFFDWAEEAGANVNLADNDISYIYVEYTGGSPAVFARTSESTDFNTKVLLATIQRTGTTLHINATDKQSVGDHANNMIRRLKATLPYGHDTGGILSETGTRNIALTAGSFWRGLTEFTTSLLDTNVTGSFSYYYSDGGSGFTKVATQTQINNANYDDGDGTLGDVSNNKYGVHWVYLEADDDDVAVVYGLGNYTLQQAQDATAPTSIPEFLQVEGILAGKIIIEQSASTFTQVESAFATKFSGSLATDHGNIAGLGDDDHTIYLLADGTRNVSAELIFDTGARFSYINATTTLIDTLSLTNALTVANGGTGITSCTDGGLILGSGTSSFTCLGVAANGQIPIGDGTTDPVLATITGTANELTVTNGAGSITLDLPSAVYLGTSGQIGRDADNLIDFVTDNKIMFRTSATDNRLVIDASGNIGINDDTPDSVFDVQDTDGNTLFQISDAGSLGNSTTTGTSTVGGLRITDEGAPEHGLEIFPGATTTLKFF